MMKSAIVGCGSIAKVHADALNQLEEMELIAFADIKKERADELAAQYHGKAYSSLEEMIEHEQIDVLHICTPHYLHTPMVLYAREHGIHVFSEKPPAISREQFKQLAEQKSDTRLGICFQNRYNQSVQYIKELLESKKPGRILGARAFVTWSRDEKYYTESGWRGVLATEGGGVLINQAIHTLDLLVYFLGKPISVEATASTHHLKNVIEVEDTVEAYIDFGDKTANFYATNSYCANSPVLVEIACENMTIRMEEKQVTLYYPDGSKEEHEFSQLKGLGKDYWGNSHKICIQEFYHCVAEQKPFALETKDIAETMSLMYGIYESAKNKTVIEL